MKRRGTVSALAHGPFCASGGSNRNASQWIGVGLGQSTGHPLVQAGVDMTGNNNPYVWIETYPQQPFEEPKDEFLVSPHDVMYVHVVSQTNHQVFHVIDQSIGYDRTYTKSYTGTPDGHAEFIVERPCDNGVMKPIPYWTDDNRFLGARSAYAGHWYPGGSLPYYGNYAYSVSTAQTVLYPGSWTANHYDFPDPYVNAGGTDSC